MWLAPPISSVYVKDSTPGNVGVNSTPLQFAESLKSKKRGFWEKGFCSRLQCLLLPEFPIDGPADFELASSYLFFTD